MTFFSLQAFLVNHDCTVQIVSEIRSVIVAKNRGHTYI